MAHPSCSVIITTCDRPDELRRSLSSVMNQTVHPLELIVVDDGLANSAEHLIAKQRGAYDIRYHRLGARSGASIARNAGARLARGEIIMFLDDDDTWEPRKIETQLGLFALHPEAGTVYTGMLAVNDTDDGRVLHSSRDHLSGGMWPQILYRNCIGPTSAVAIRTELFHRVGGFDVQLRALQDYDLWIRLCLAGQVVYDGAHNLRFSAISASSNRISTDTRNYKEGFEYLSRKYQTQLNLLTDWERRRFRAQAKILLASKYLQQKRHAKAGMHLAMALALYPPVLFRLSRSAFAHLAEGEKY